MPDSNVASLLEGLENVRSRPGVWMSKSLPLVMVFISRFNIACRQLGVEASPADQAYWAVLSQRGWKVSPAGPWVEMQEKGLSEEEIVTELLTIQIEALKKRHNL